MYVNERPIWWTGSNGFNFRFRFDKHIFNSLQWYYHGHYTHVGLVVVINDIPYVWQLSSVPMYDEVTQKFVSGIPALQPIKNLNLYEGCVYINQYKGMINPQLTLKVMEKIYSSDIHIQGNWVQTFLKNGFGVGTNSDKLYMCVDFLEDVLCKMGIIDSPTRKANINTIQNIIDTNPLYDSKAIMLKNVHYNEVFG